MEQEVVSTLVSLELLHLSLEPRALLLTLEPLLLEALLVGDSIRSGSRRSVGSLGLASL